MTLAETSLLEEPFCRPQPIDTPAGHEPTRERGGARDVIVPIPADFRLASGEKLNQPNIVGRLHGRVGAPVVVVAGGISAGRFVHRTETNGLGWWSGAVSVRGPIDLSRFQVLAVDFAPGAEFLDKRPSPSPPTTRRACWLLVLNHLRIERVAAFVGCSYGGMVGLAFAELFPDRAEQLIIVSAAHRAHPQATAWRGIQRRILQFAVAAGRPEEGVALARELAMTTYRTAEEFHDRFETTAPAAVGGAYPVCDYLTARGQAYRTHTTPARWLSMSDSLDRHSVTPEAIKTPVTLIGFTSDRLVPIDDIRELAARLPTLWRFVEAPSLFGHDAFLKEDAFVGDILRAAFKDIKA